MSLPELLSTLTESLTSALDALPSPTSLTAPSDGLSLFSTKNELLLSYLQNLTFFIMLKLRALAADPAPTAGPTTTTHTTHTADTAATAADPIHDAVVQTLVALGVYMEKGVRPLESRLAYQVDKLLLAANSAPTPGSKGSLNTSLPGGARSSKSPLSSRSASPSSSQIPPLAHRPNPASLLPPPSSSSSSKARHYRPPHITPAAPPTISRAPRVARTQRKSAALEEFVREEMGDAPVAEMSTGAGSGAGGKAADRESERRAYEEGRLVRLPGVKRRKISAQGGEWEGLGLDKDEDRDRAKGGKRGKGRKGR